MSLAAVKLAAISWRDWLGSRGLRASGRRIPDHRWLYPAAQRIRRMRTDLQSVISQTSALPSRAGIQTLEQGDAVVLPGSVASEQEDVVSPKRSCV